MADHLISASAITRLVDIGVEPFLISSSVLAVVAQRLVRVLFDHCKEAYTPGVILESIGISREQLRHHTIYQANGCEECFNTGYRGRTTILELLSMTDPIRRLVMQHATSGEIEKQAIKEGMRTMYLDGMKKCLEGKTTVEEILRVTQES